MKLIFLKSLPVLTLKMCIICPEEEQGKNETSLHHNCVLLILFLSKYKFPAE